MVCRRETQTRPAALMANISWRNTTFCDEQKQHDSPPPVNESPAMIGFAMCLENIIGCKCATARHLQERQNFFRFCICAFLRERYTWQ